MSHRVDQLFLWIVVALTVGGFLIFSSASVGLIAREGASFGGVAATQLAATALGGALAYFLSRTRHRALRRAALPLFLASIGMMLLVFIPRVGVSYGGAHRWIDLFGISFQPSELFKIAVVLYYAAFLAGFRERVTSFSYGFMPLFVLTALSGALLLTQPDTDTLIVIGITLAALFLIAGGRAVHIALLIFIAGIGLSVLIVGRPYLKERLLTFLDPARDPQGAGYQIQQSLLAVGSGGTLGRGFGQSIQKFQYLPEPIGDSVFAVAAEEFGFFGSVLLVALFLAFLLRGLSVAARAPDSFGGLLAAGIVILITASAFMNMASMLGIIPLSGLPLPFVSHGGTALMLTLAEVGVVLNISRYQRS